jgi:hypothetical protein
MRKPREREREREKKKKKNMWGGGSLSLPSLFLQYSSLLSSPPFIFSFIFLVFSTNPIASAIPLLILRDGFWGGGGGGGGGGPGLPP